MIDVFHESFRDVSEALYRETVADHRVLDLTQQDIISAVNHAPDLSCLMAVIEDRFFWGEGFPTKTTGAVLGFQQGFSVGFYFGGFQSAHPVCMPAPGVPKSMVVSGDLAQNHIGLEPSWILGFLEKYGVFEPTCRKSSL